MINCRSTHLSLIYRSNHNLISLLKNPRKALKSVKETNKVPPKKNEETNKAHPKENDQTNKVPLKFQKLYNNDELLSKFPKEFYHKVTTNSKMSHQLYLVNEVTAAKIAQYLTHLPDPHKTLVETNPGPGILTGLLIESGVNDLRLFEGREEFLAHLEQAYAKVYPDRVKLKSADLICLHRVLHSQHLLSRAKNHEILSDLPIVELQNDISFRLFGATGSTSFFKQLIGSIVFQRGLLALGRCELYIVIPSTTYITLTSSTKSGYSCYRSFSILFQIFFEYELLDKFPRTDFLPHISNCLDKSAPNRRNRRAKDFVEPSQIDPELMYFMKIVPRRDFQLGPPNEMQELWHFIKCNCTSRQNRIIRLLEKLMPGCGARLLPKFSTEPSIRSQPIKTVNLCETPPTTNPSMTLSHQDYYDKLNIFTQFGDLQPSEMFTLFREFRMLPDYLSCGFLASLDSVLVKMGAKPDENGARIVKSSDDDNSIDDQVAEKECNVVEEK